MLLTLLAFITIDPSKLVDLTYPYDESTIYWPTSPKFAWKKDAWGKSSGGYWYTSATFTTSEHGGTHIDSPIHFAEGRWSTAEIPVGHLAGAAIVIDVTKACENNPDCLVTAADIERWERMHGRIPASSIVMIRTGWGKRWPDARRYLGTDKRGDTTGLRFPGLSQAAAEMLVQRGPYGVGIDTASLDYGRSTNYLAHRALNAANIYGLENVANLHTLPETGATVIALPVKIANGTGGPVRIISILP
jgi:kynurenine formamidase